MQQYYDPYGGAAQYAPQGFIGDLVGTAGGLAQQYLPFGADPQFAPQGWVGNMLGRVAAPVGGMIGGHFGNANLGRQIGGVAGNLARRYIPFGAEADFAPQGYAGDPSGGMAQQYQPYGADPQFAPQGWVGNMLGRVAAPVGGMIGGHFGNANLGRQIGGVAGNLARRYIPFGAEADFGPQGYAGDPSGGMAQQYQPYGVDPQFAPQGAIGNFLGRAAPTIGSWIGGRYGNAPLGQLAGTTAGGLIRRYLPFGAEADFGPQGYAGDPSGGMAQQYQPYGADPQFAPQGWTDALRRVVSNPWVQRAASTGIRRFLPFGAEADFGAQGYAGDPSGGMAQQYLPYGADPQFAPQGFWGNLIGRVAAPVGSLIGGPVGGLVGGAAGGLARRYIPFSADPFDPYGQGQVMA